ncbi:unnamed protein product [Closterium sp. NIES-54]
MHQQSYVDKLRKHFIDEEQTQRISKRLVSVDSYAELTFDDEDAQEQEEDEYRKKVGSLHFAVTTKPDIVFPCSKLRSDLTVMRDQHWREFDHYLTYLADTLRDASTESDYVAATEADKMARWLHFLRADFQLLDAGTPTVILVDNKLAITVAEGLGLKATSST